MTSVLTVARQDGAHVLTLNRPEKMNALSAELVEALIAAVEQAQAEAADLIVLRGEGKNLSAGFDFGDWQTQSEGDLLLRFVRIETLLQKLASSTCLTVAFAQGKNFGAGVDLFGSCRIRVATEGASFRMPGLQFGLVLGTRRFAALVGAERARSILGQSTTFSGQEALQYGFVTQLALLDEWAAIEEASLATARALTPSSRAQLYQALSSESADEDLARLVRSAAEPGIKARVARYLQAR